MFSDFCQAPSSVILPVATDVIDVVLAGNDYVYAFPRADQWETIRCVHIPTEVETQSGGYSIYAGTLAKLHPWGDAIYGADSGLSPSDIEKYDITEGTAQLLYDSPYHGDYAMCGNLWISKDGLRIFTRCGNVFRSSEAQAQDMLSNGSLTIPGMTYLSVKALDHSSAANQVALIPEPDYWNGGDFDTKLARFDYDYLQYVEQVQLPMFTRSGASYQSHGRFVFYHSSGEQVFVIVQADETSGFLHDYGVVTYK